MKRTARSRRVLFIVGSVLAAIACRGDTARRVSVPRTVARAALATRSSAPPPPAVPSVVQTIAPLEPTVPVALVPGRIRSDGADGVALFDHDSATALTVAARVHVD